MSGKMRGTSRKSDFLDKLFGNKRRTILGALGVAIIGYLLFLLFGNIYATEDALYRPVVMGVLAFVALFLVLGFQLINPFCSANAMDIAELLFALFGGMEFVCNDTCLSATILAEVAGMWCAICLIHNMRK